MSPQPPPNNISSHHFHRGNLHRLYRRILRASLHQHQPHPKTYFGYRCVALRCAFRNKLTLPCCPLSIPGLFSRPKPKQDTLSIDHYVYVVSCDCDPLSHAMIASRSPPSPTVCFALHYTIGCCPTDALPFSHYVSVPLRKLERGSAPPTQPPSTF